MKYVHYSTYLWLCNCMQWTCVAGADSNMIAMWLRAIRAVRAGSEGKQPMYLNRNRIDFPQPRVNCESAFTVRVAQLLRTQQPGETAALPRCPRDTRHSEQSSHGYWTGNTMSNVVCESAVQSIYNPLALAPLGGGGGKGPKGQRACGFSQIAPEVLGISLWNLPYLSGLIGIVIGIIKNNHINHILTDEIGSQAVPNCQRLYLTLPIGR